MKALVVGAGAVGQVYGLHLQRGGATVGVFVKDKHLAAAQAGFTLHPVRRAGTNFAPDSVLCDAQAVGEHGPWDQVWLCMSSPALRAWPAVGEVLSAAGPDATVICLQPGIEDMDFVADKLGGDERLVQGLITMISWHAPLPGQQVDPPGVAFWLPPGAAPPFAGAPARAKAVAESLAAGGYAARARKDIRGQSAFGSATLLPLMAGLELAGWTFSGLRAGRWLTVACRAGRQAHPIAAARLGRRGGGLLLRLLLQPWVLGLVSRIAPIVTPFPLEIYLREHFTKVGDQTRDHLDRYLQLAGDRRLRCDALAELRQGLTALDGG